MGMGPLDIQILRRALASKPIGGNWVRPTNAIEPGNRQPKQQVIERARGITTPYLVTNQSQQVLPIDFDRKYLLVENNDAAGIIYASWGIAGVYGQGIVINPNNGYYLADYNCPTAQLFLIGSIALNGNVSITTG